MTGAARLALREVRKSFGAVEVLHGIDIAMAPGEVQVVSQTFWFTC